jgi:hypothetical protein
MTTPQTSPEPPWNVSNDDDSTQRLAALGNASPTSVRVVGEMGVVPLNSDDNLYYVFDIILLFDIIL